MVKVNSEMTSVCSVPLWLVQLSRKKTTETRRNTEGTRRNILKFRTTPACNAMPFDIVTVYGGE